MLPTDLLAHRFVGETITPKYINVDDKNLTNAMDIINCFHDSVGQTQGYLDQQLIELESDRPDYRLLRGFSHLLKGGFCTFEVVSPLVPQELRQRVFTLSSQSIPSYQNTALILQNLADSLSQELNKEILTEQIINGLYADLSENKILTNFDAPNPEDLIHRYNLSQVQGIFYRATEIIIHAHRNVPGQYKILFRYLKLFGLMAYIEGDADHGFTISIDGPVSLFKPSTRYGLAIAKLIPALLHVTKWSLSAQLQIKDQFTNQIKSGRFTLNSETKLVSHYPPGKAYDSMLEESFADRWEKLKTEWKLEREVDLIPIPGSVMIPDFRLVHPSGKFYLLEIVGYWRTEYLQKKFAQVKKSNCDYLILAISERLNLEKAGIKVSDIPVKVIWFKDKLNPKSVLEVLT
jgi:uncharacterized protein